MSAEESKAKEESALKELERALANPNPSWRASPEPLTPIPWGGSGKSSSVLATVLVAKRVAAVSAEGSKAKVLKELERALADPNPSWRASPESLTPTPWGGSGKSSSVPATFLVAKRGAAVSAEESKAKEESALRSSAFGPF